MVGYDIIPAGSVTTTQRNGTFLPKVRSTAALHITCRSLLVEMIISSLWVLSPKQQQQQQQEKQNGDETLFQIQLFRKGRPGSNAHPLSTRLPPTSSQSLTSLGQTTLLLARMQLAHNIPKHTRYILLKHHNKNLSRKRKNGTTGNSNHPRASLQLLVLLLQHSFR
jgi:hypothetical protein